MVPHRLHARVVALADRLVGIETRPAHQDVGNIVEDLDNILPQNLINAAIVCTVMPVVIIYPFLQRYFIHGVIVGAVKG